MIQSSFLDGHVSTSEFQGVVDLVSRHVFREESSITRTQEPQSMLCIRFCVLIWLRSIKLSSVSTVSEEVQVLQLWQGKKTCTNAGGGYFVRSEIFAWTSWCDL